MTWNAADLVNSATMEWQRWGKSTAKAVNGKPKLVIGHSDDDATWAQIVIDEYCSLVGDRPSVFEISSDDYAWSAVGICTMLKRAGVTEAEFPFSNSHSTYIRHFVAARKNQIDSAYWAYRLGEPAGAPAVGDLVAYGRGEGMNFAKAQKLFDSTKRYKSHTDLVVAKRPGEIDVIGANVFDSVTKKTLPISADGHISDRHFHWFAVLKLRQ